VSINLIGELLPPGIDHSEALQVISQHFASSRSTPNGDVDYPNSDRYAIRVRHKHGELVEIRPGPALTSETLRQLQSKIFSDLVEDEGTSIQRCILFASQPVMGCFRSRTDRLRILPPPTNAPKPPYLVADHPFVLEFPMHGSKNSLISILRRTRQMLEWVSVLNAILTPKIRALGPRMRHMWALCPAVGSDTSYQRVNFVQEYYAVDGFAGEASAFSDDARPAPTALQSDYYGNTLRPTQELDVPDCLSELIESFVQLGPSDRKRFLRAAHWVSVGNDQWNIHVSSYFISLITAVETLVPPAMHAEKCATCGRDAGPGPTQRFHDFVEQYLPANKFTLNRKYLYRVRSDLAHGWKLFQVDVAPWLADLTTTALEEREAWMDLAQTVRIVLVNWLKSKAGQASV
jgi:hypothetical protein